MTPLYSVLYLEDSDLDAELVLTRLARSDLPIEVERADSRDRFETLLQQKSYDLVLSDYQVPRMEGLEALELARRYHPEIPFIYVSGAMGEELAIDTLQRGATDYVLKQRLARLHAAVERALSDVRERRALRQSESAAREAQDKLRFALEGAELAAWELNLDTEELTCTSQFHRMLGQSPETPLTYAQFLDAIVPEDRQRVRAAFQQSHQERTSQDLDFRVRWPTGELRWMNLRGRYLPPTDSSPPRLGGVSLDITARKQSEQQLEDRENQFRTMFESNPDCVKLVAADGTLLEMNRTGLRLMEAECPEQVLGTSVYDAIAPEFREAFRALNERVCRGEQGQLEFDLIGLRGTRRHMETSAVPLRFQGQTVQLAITRDVSDRKRAERALQHSEAQFRQLAESIPNLAWMAHPDGHIFWYNSRWYEYTGRSLEEMEGWGWQSVHDPEYLPVVLERWKRSLATGEPFEMVFPLRGADSVFRPFLTRVQPFYGSNHEILYWFGTNTDIAAQKETEASLAQTATQERHRADLLSRLAVASQNVNANLSLDSITNVLAIEARRILEVHVAAVTVAVETQGSAPRRTLSLSGKFANVSDRDGLARIEEVLQSSQGLRVPLISHTGLEYGVVQVADKIRGGFSSDDRAVLQQLANIASVGIENSQLYESLREQDRRKDEFLATLAHELRNPLAPLRNAIGILRLKPDATPGPLVEMMERQLRHMVRLIDDLLDISRISRNKMELRRTRIALADVITSAVEASRPSIEAAGHSLEVQLPETAVWLDGDLTRLAQVFSNLLSNSVKYTNAGQIAIVAEVSDGLVSVSVRDDGIGIPPEALARIFDMFWQVDRSIERQTGGLGIGLALVKGIVEMHGGTITASSEGVNRGSEFRVQLPVLAVETFGREVVTEDGPATGTQGRRILVVDDNVDSALSMSRMLKLVGYDVATAHDGLQALDVAEQFDPEVILMDVGMPRLNGYEAARRIRDRKGARVKIIALTGWGQDADRDRSREAGCDIHLVKPVAMGELQTVLASLGTVPPPDSQADPGLPSPPA